VSVDMINGPQPGPKDPKDLPIHPTEALSQQARTSLMRAEERDLGVFLYSTDCRRPDQVERLRGDLARCGGERLLPDDDGIHYLFVTTKDGEAQPVLVPEFAAPWVVLGMFAVLGEAGEVQHQIGVLP
jgi:hypothetical protein